MRAVLSLAFAAFATAGAADAATWRFDISGFFTSQDSLAREGQAPVAFSGDTPFKVRAVFDDTSPSLVAGIPLPGFAAYAPISASITIDGVRYGLTSVTDDLKKGVAIMLFDPSNVFNPTFWAAGLLADPANNRSQAGFVARFADTDPPFSVTDIEATVFEDFRGVGFNSGSRNDGPGPGTVCWVTPSLCDVEPWQLTAADGTVYALSFSPRPYSVDPNRTLFAASIAPVPLPAAGLMLLGGLAALAIPAIRRRR